MNCPSSQHRKRRDVPYRSKTGTVESAGSDPGKRTLWCQQHFPGLTGWAQIHGRDTLEIKDKAAYDGYYVQHLSFFLDLKCLFGTVIAVLERKGFMEGGTGNKDQPVKHKLIICTNHSYMFYQFHRELIEALADSYRILLITPFTGHIKELTDAGQIVKEQSLTGGAAILLTTPDYSLIICVFFERKNRIWSLHIPSSLIFMPASSAGF